MHLVPIFHGTVGRGRICIVEPFCAIVPTTKCHMNQKTGEVIEVTSTNRGKVGGESTGFDLSF